MIILFGGNGFLGRHLTDLLLKSKRPSMVITRRPLKPEERLSGIEYLSEEDRGTPIWQDALLRAKAFVYLASQSVPGTFVAAPWQELSHNVEPALKLFTEICAINPSLKIVFLSSGGAIYGSTIVDRVDENSPILPISAYGLGKWMIEEALKFTYRTGGQPYAILRVSNPVGRHQTSKTQGIVPAAMRAIRNNQSLNIFGDGLHVRDYIDADDAATAILASCDTQSHLAQTWNLGSGIGRSILDILNCVEQVTGKKIKLEFKPSRLTDVSRIVLNSSKLQSELGWSPKRSLQESCKSVWNAIGP
jgi:UDP-glucose 4-epimerase